MRSEAEARTAVVQEGLSWLKTPYHHRAREKGAGVDCGMILLAIYEAAGVLPHIAPEAYPQDWHLYRSEERYLGYAQEHLHQIEGPPLPGDIALFRFGRCVSHGALVIQWPMILHAYRPAGEVVLDDAEANQDLCERLVGFWSPWGGA